MGKVGGRYSHRVNGKDVDSSVLMILDGLQHLLKVKKTTASLLAVVFLCASLFAHAEAPPTGSVLTNVATLSYDGEPNGVSSSVDFTVSSPISGDEPQSPTDITLTCAEDPECEELFLTENEVGQVLSNDLTAVDADHRPGSHQFFVTDDIRFEVIGGQLKLADGESIDFEAEPEIIITLRAVDPDGLIHEKKQKIKVRDVNEAPFDLLIPNSYVVPGSTERRIGVLSVSDQDNDERHRYTVIDDDRFIVQDITVLTLAEGVVLPPDTTIPITISVSDKGGLKTRLIVEVTTIPPSPAPPPPSDFPSIDFMAPNATGTTIDVPEATCSPAAGFVLDSGATSLRVNFAPGDVSGSQSLAPVDAYAIGDPLIVTVTDISANLHPFERDRIDVRLAIDATGDSELLTLVETDLDTGLFYGFVFTTSRQSTINDCILTVTSNTRVDASYTSQSGVETVTTLAAIGPVGVLFNDNTGEPISGVILALINDVTGEPAVVSGDGPIFAPYPATVITGETVTDAAGGVYENGPGEYRFPAIPDGRYRLVIFNDEGWNFSAKIDEEVQQLGGQQSLTSTSDGRFTLNIASRGEPFEVGQGALPKVDIPVKQLVRLASVQPTPSKIEFLQYSSNPSVGSPVDVGETTCVDGSTRQVSELRDKTVPVPGTVNLLPITVIKAGQPIFVRVTDLDQNADPLVRDTITILLSVPASGDREFIRLQETGPDTGQFVGYIQSAADESDVGSCMLGVVTNQPIQTRYSDVFDSADISESQILVDPFGKIFSTKDGRLIDGVTVTLIDTATGQPAEVFGDGPAFAAYPNPIVSGGQAVDDAGVVYDFPAGEYRFPFVEPGFYQFQLSQVPTGFIFPSSASNDAIQVLPGAPFQVVDGSFGDEFEVPVGPALNIDLPLDEPLGDIFVNKQVNKELAAIGDFVQYTLLIQNNANSVVSNTRVQDILPLGFRYQPDSLRIADQKVTNPEILSDGRTLLIDLPAVGGASVKVTYVAEITPGASLGEAVNTATVIGEFVATSNTGSASVMVGNDLFSDKAFLVGRVSLEQCHDVDGGDEKEGKAGKDGVELDSEPEGIPGVRLYLEDGSYVITDDKGMWHMEGINPGTHIVQLDVDSLEERYEVSPCNTNSRFAGSAYSQFVDVRGGTLWRADFKVQEKAPPESQVELTQTLKVDGEGVWVSVKAENKGPVMPSNVSIIYNVPKGWQIVAGSEKLDGNATSGSQTIVGSMYKIGNLAGSAELRMKIEPKDSRLESVQPPNQLSVLRPRFKTRSAELSDEDKTELELLLQELSQGKWEQITVVGHSDNVPISPANRDEFADNKALSTARAEAVASYLAGKVEVENLVVVGAGDIYPIASNETRSGREQNRRVELLLKPAEVSARRIVSAEALNGESGVRLGFTSPGTPKGRTELNKLPLNRLVGGFEKLSATVSGKAVGSWDLVAPDIREELVERDPNTQGIISIRDGQRMGRPVHAVKVDLDSRLKPRLLLDGEEVSSERIGFSMADEETGKSIYSYIGVNFGEPGQHELKLEGIGPFGNVRFTESINVVRVGELFNVDLVSAEGNVADGSKPVTVKLKLTDRQGEELGIPHVLMLDGGDLSKYDKDLNLSDLSLIDNRKEVQVSADGILRFNPVSTSGVYRAVLKFDDIEEEIEVFVAPEKRDWIMVGLAEGSVAYSQVSGNMQNIQDAGLDEDIETDGRVSFYAKGQVKGEFILTIAYDTGKERKDSLEQTIDPNSFYTLYGDRTQTQFDAASQEKLYLKLEKDQFYALFGDFTTGLTGGELTNYSRSLTGLKSEFEGDRFEVVLFASEADQAFIKDEIRGDGTSGLYRLTTPGLVVNSEKIKIEVRDRFQSQDIVDTIELTRHIDYNIDYDAGTLFFKQPIFSQDVAFNPIFIVIDYEVDARGTDELNTGGRVAYKPNEKTEVGLTLVKEGTERREGELAGIDILYEVDDQTEIKAEFAGTRSKVDGVGSDGTAYVVEATRRTEKIDATAYAREQKGSFGLGQQNASESGTRKIGVNAVYQVAEGIEVAGEMYRQTDLASGANEDVATTTMQMQGDQYSVNTGIRTAMSEREGVDQVSNQLLVGGNYRILDGKLVLSANADTPIAGKGEAGNFPKRLRVGLDYRLTDEITLKAEQEFTWGDAEDTQGTRIGLSSQLWEGGELVTSVEQRDEENSQRLAAVAGLKQRFDLNENWSFDFGVDRSQTIKQVRKAPPPLTVTTVFSSPDNDDFTSLTFGSKFRKDAWDWATRVEYREADSQDKVNLLSDVIHNLDDGQQLLAKLDVQMTDSEDSESTKANIQLGYSYRPEDSRWTLFNRLDLRHSVLANLGLDQTTQKIVNNLNANYIWSDETQIAFQYGFKYVVDNFDSDQYRGYTDLYGMEVRHDLSNRWDVGFQGSLYNSYNADVSDYSYGVSVGYNMAKNVWVSLGYNFDGFQDDDFTASEYTSEGVFFKYRFKFDQNTAGGLLGLMGN